MLEKLNEARFLKNYLGMPLEAIKICDTILKIDPQNHDALLIKAGALQESGKFKEFTVLITHIIELWPNHWEGHYLLALFCFMGRKDHDALMIMEQSLECEENFNNVISYAQILYLTGSDNYKNYIDKAKRIDLPRAENFLKNEWVWDTDELNPSFKDKMKAAKLRKSIKEGILK